MVFFVRLGGATSKIFLMFTPPKNGGKWFNPSYFFSDKGWFNRQLEDDFFHHFSSGIPWSHLQLRRRPLQSSKRTDRRRWRRCNVNSANGKYRSPRGAGMWSPSFCETFVRLDSWPLKTLKSEVFLLKLFFLYTFDNFCSKQIKHLIVGWFWLVEVPMQCLGSCLGIQGCVACTGSSHERGGGTGHCGRGKKPFRELTNPPSIRHVWRWFSSSQGGIMLVSWRVFKESKVNSWPV